MSACLGGKRVVWGVNALSLYWKTSVGFSGRIGGVGGRVFGEVGPHLWLRYITAKEMSVVVLCVYLLKLCSIN